MSATTADIATRQDSPEYLDLIAAKSFYYRRAKTFIGIQFCVSVLGSIAIAWVARHYEDWKVWTTCIALTIPILDALVLDRLQAHYRTLGARVQERFDRKLFILDWSAIGIPKKPGDDETVHEAEAYRRKNPEMTGKKGWYSAEVDKLPLAYARLVCQDASCSWDKTIRKAYKNGLWVVLLATIGIIVAIAMVNNTGSRDLIVELYAPLAPAVLWIAKEILRQTDAIKGLEELHGKVEAVWEKGDRGELDETALTDRSMLIQDRLFAGRARNSLVFDWVNNLTRPRNQVTMEARAKFLVGHSKHRIKK